MIKKSDKGNKITRRQQDKGTNKMAGFKGQINLYSQATVQSLGAVVKVWGYI